jgi:TRAP-type transport system small permease protein
MDRVDRLLEVLDRLARFVALALVTAVISLLSAQIFFRYALNSSITWSEEVATWCLVWIVFIGSASIMRRWEHVNVPMVIRALPMNIRPLVIIFAKIATCVAVALIAYYGVQVVMGTFHRNSQITGVDTRWIKLSVPIGAGLMTVFALYCAIDDIRRWRRGETDYFRDYGDLGLGDETAETAQRNAPGS